MVMFLQTRMSGENKKSIYILQILFVSSISYGSQRIQFEEFSNWGVVVARYVVYLLLIRASQEASCLGYNFVKTKQRPDLLRILEKSKVFLMILGASAAVLVYLKQTIMQGEFLLLFIGYLIAKYPEMEEKPTMINYGTGMALSFIEGYLVHVIPSDGADMVGIEDNMRAFEARHGIVFPVKRLFIIITKSLYCPPDLKSFNKPNRDDLPYLEARQSLQEVQKDVAGVKGRTYRNSVYRVARPALPPVSLAAECATPLHTLHRALQRRLLYEHLANVDLQQVVYDFCNTLQTIIDKSPDFRGKCELVYFDDTDPTQNLADVLLDKIRELEPNFENITVN